MQKRMAVADENLENYRIIVENFILDRLDRRGFHEILPNRRRRNLTEFQLEVAHTLRRVGDELETRNENFFEHMFDQLNITPNTAYGTFEGIANEIFLTERNWGRIVAFLTFGSTLAIHCASRDDLGTDFVEQIINWVAIYMRDNLDPWIRQHGSWNGFVDFFERDDVIQNENPGGNGFIFAALAGLGIGALLTMSFK